MHREYHHWFSRALHRDMEMLVFGHAGRPVLVFPTSMGAFFEYEDRGMVGALATRTRSRAPAAVLRRRRWTVRAGTTGARIPASGCSGTCSYEDYILNDLVPLVRHLTWRDTIGVTGCSFGAYHAMALALRTPISSPRA